MKTTVINDKCININKKVLFRALLGYYIDPLFPWGAPLRVPPRGIGDKRESMYTNTVRIHDRVILLAGSPRLPNKSPPRTEDSLIKYWENNRILNTDQTYLTRVVPNINLTPSIKCPILQTTYINYKDININKKY